MSWTDRLDRLREHLPWRRDRGGHVHIHRAHHAVGPPQGLTVLVPRVSIYENRSEILVQADVPGAQVDGTEIHVDGNTLEISARGTMPGGRRALLSELAEGTWYRRFLLPHRVKTDDATAALVAGLLTIHLPKS